MITRNLTQAIAVLGAIDPGASQFAAGSYYTETIDASIYPRLAALVTTGTLAGAGTVNVRFQHCSGSLSSDSAWADVSSASCITSSFGSASNSKRANLELRCDQHPEVSRYVRALATVATSTWNGGVTVIGNPPTFGPAKDVDATAVTQIVVY